MSAAASIPRPEYPRPSLRRERWANLNGVWSFAFDDDDCGVAEGWPSVSSPTAPDGPFQRTIVVPFAYQTRASTVHDAGLHQVVWYARSLDGGDMPAVGERLMLHFGAVDYHAMVWVNGRLVAEHEGGYTPFAADITESVTGHQDVVVVRASDPVADLDQPRGKQYWKQHADDVFYTGGTGIWQTVWLEPVPRARVQDLAIMPMLDDASVEITASVTAAALGQRLTVRISLEGRLLVDDSALVTGGEVRRRWNLVDGADYADASVIDHRGIATWSPDNPRLYDVEVEIHGESGVVDRVESYFGMRKVETRDGQVLLNHRPLYQRLVLDQGYFPDGGYTASSDEELRGDIELAKQMGFNGARKHQKAEDPRWLYWADRLGFVVWSEMPSGFRYSSRYVKRVTAEWQQIVLRDRNHPCILVWTPVNESWGVPALRGEPDPAQTSFVAALYHLTKALDPSRLVVGNDGWEHMRTDLFTMHHYGDAADLRATFADRRTAVTARPLHRHVYAPGFEHRGEPVIVSEFGGVAFADATNESDPQVPTWGFHTVADSDGLLARYAEFVDAVAQSPVVVGFCWTQLTDIQQEANGLLRADRTPKVDPAAIREVNLAARARRTRID